MLISTLNANKFINPLKEIIMPAIAKSARTASTSVRSTTKKATTMTKTVAPSKKTTAAKKTPAKKIAPVVKRAPAKKAAPVRAVKTAAQLRAIAKRKAERIAAVKENFAPVKTTFNRAQLFEHIAEQTGLTKRDVSNVFGEITNLMMGSMMPRGSGEFTLPGLLKVVTKKIPAKKGGQKVMSFGVERISKPKPATVRVKARLLARVKQVALPV
jgi:hypothetical protein